MQKAEVTNQPTLTGFIPDEINPCTHTTILHLIPVNGSYITEEKIYISLAIKQEGKNRAH